MTPQEIRDYVAALPANFSQPPTQAKLWGEAAAQIAELKEATVDLRKAVVDLVGEVKKLKP